MLHIRGDFLYVDLCVCLLLPIHVLLQEGEIPPLDVRNWVAPRDLRFDLSDLYSFLFLLLVLLLLFLLSLLLVLFFLLTAGLLLQSLHNALFLGHESALFQEPEGSSSRAVCSLVRSQGRVDVGLVDTILLHAQQLLHLGILLPVLIDLERANHLCFQRDDVSLFVQLTAKLIQNELPGLGSFPRKEARCKALALQFGHLLLDLPLHHRGSLGLLQGVPGGRGCSREVQRRPARGREAVHSRWCHSQCISSHGSQNQGIWSNRWSFRLLAPSVSPLSGLLRLLLRFLCVLYQLNRVIFRQSSHGTCSAAG
mmetsp:Transcript_27036/g.57364  ORF Transcript_27036/g.57364 Transcript_27036/m.57364 type:complete len:310 (-) Transcript_27036:117-1046(-)